MHDVGKIGVPDRVLLQQEPKDSLLFHLLCLKLTQPLAYSTRA